MKFYGQPNLLVTVTRHKRLGGNFFLKFDEHGELEIEDEALISRFKKAFRTTNSKIPPQLATVTSEVLYDLKRKDLFDLCKELNVPEYWKMRNEEMIAILENAI